MSLLTKGSRPCTIVVVKKPPPKPVAVEPRPAARLAYAVNVLVNEHAAEFRLTQGSVLGALTLVLARAAGAIAREGDKRLEPLLDFIVRFIVRHLRRAASDEFTQRSYPLH
jgi:hypothetical protein